MAGIVSAAVVAERSAGAVDGRTFWTLPANDGVLLEGNFHAVYLYSVVLGTNGGAVGGCCGVSK